MNVYNIENLDFYEIHLIIDSLVGRRTDIEEALKIIDNKSLDSELSVINNLLIKINKGGN